MRYTEYHAGVPVIRDKELLPGAMKKLAKLEDLENIPEIICDEYCKYPFVCSGQETLDHICGECRLKELFEALDEGGEICIQEQI